MGAVKQPLKTIYMNVKTVPFEFCKLLGTEICIFGTTKSWTERILMNLNYLSTHFLSNCVTTLDIRHLNIANWILEEN